MTLEEKARESSINACLCTNMVISQPSYEKGYIAGAEENGVIWHDLQKDPTDLPKDNDVKRCYVGNGEYQNLRYSKCRWYYSDKGGLSFIRDIIAWCEKPTFDKE